MTASTLILAFSSLPDLSKSATSFRICFICDDTKFDAMMILNVLKVVNARQSCGIAYMNKIDTTMLSTCIMLTLANRPGSDMSMSGYKIVTWPFGIISFILIGS